MACSNVLRSLGNLVCFWYNNCQFRTCDGEEQNGGKKAGNKHPVDTYICRLNRSCGLTHHRGMKGKLTYICSSIIQQPSRGVFSGAIGASGEQKLLRAKNHVQ